MAKTSTAPRARIPAPTPGADDRAQIQVIARAAAILRTLENQERGLSLGQIANQVDLPRSTVQRIVAALQAERLLISTPPNGGVRLGPALIRIAASVRVDSLALARPLIVQLSQTLDETIDISIPKRDRAIFVDQVGGSQRLRAVSAVGEDFPLHCTANGKAFLASLDDRDVIARIGRTYEKRTGATRTNFAALARDLEAIRRDGYALDRDEHTEGVSAAGIMLRGVTGEALLVSVPVPTIRFAERSASIIARLLALKADLETQFGSAD